MGKSIKWNNLPPIPDIFNNERENEMSEDAGRTWRLGIDRSVVGYVLNSDLKLENLTAQWILKEYQALEELHEVARRMAWRRRAVLEAADSGEDVDFREVYILESLVDEIREKTVECLTQIRKLGGDDGSD